MKSFIKLAVFFLFTLVFSSQKSIAQSSTFSYTGAVQSYTVPAFVYSVAVDAKGGCGGGAYVSCGSPGPVALGGRVQCALAVTPGQILYVYVGGLGPSDNCGIPTIGGWNGGVNGGGFGAASGGGSDIRYCNACAATATNRLVVAGAGGGGGDFSGTGGCGGGLTGGSGFASTLGGTGGSGGTQIGAGPIGGSFGSLGAGGPLTSYDGGGGGYWGGNGGVSFGGGGGGSSYTDPILCTSVTHTQCYSGANGNGQVIINVLCSTPIAGAITAPDSVCVGSALTLTNPTGTPGGAWTSTNTAIATINSATGVVTGASAGVVTISYSLVLSCGSAFASTTLTVNPTPLPISGGTTICTGSSITLTDGTSSGTWSSSNTLIAFASATTGSISGVGQGTATIAYTLATGCSVNTIVTVNNAPAAIGGPSTVCMGSTILLTNTSSGGSWSSSNTAVATIGAAGGLVTPGSPGTVIMSYSNGCGAPAVKVITVNPVPSIITGTTSICITATTALADSTAGGVWSSSATGIATIGSLSGVAAGITSGSTIISYTLPTGCASSVMLTVIPPLAPISGPHRVCTGSTVFLGGTPAGGTWVSGNTASATVGLSSGVVTGVSLGTTVITYTAGVGCSATMVMTVNPIAPIVGHDSVCVGSTTVLTDIVGSGVWSTSNASIATILLDSGVVTGLIPGNVTIVYLVPSTGCTRSVAFSVIKYPDPVTGTPKTCPGFATTLFDMVPAGGVWSSSNPAVATVGASTGIVSGITPDTATISYTILPGCAATQRVTVNPLPAVITGNTPVCPGAIDSMHDATPGGLWSTSSAALATVIDTSGVVITLASAGGTDIITYTLPTGCYRTKILSINPIPVPPVTYDAFTNTLYTDSTMGFVSYQWYDSIAGIIPGATSPSVAALYNEYYYVVVTDTFGCIGVSPFIHYSPTELGINPATKMRQIKVFPNPVSGTLYINSPVSMKAVITAIDGKAEIEQKDATKVDVSHLSPGVYLIKLYDSGGILQSVQKFTKE